ncbi:hypothetical protein [Caenispirillum bisanense]|uniref:Toprim domain-containing protein n=1 Tax=Caenispirillum bisanense TaxID=414052 RepID=A0A286GLZ5_9PROT|nr:hypothetical protein [Caenispirillum bisanense]SOD96547.1 hypothetical protein SAMN05421508_105408 [Caenispirillum bisanense]
MTDTAIAKTFAPLTEEERSRSAANDNAGREELLTTVPPDAPQPDFNLRGFKVALVSDYQNLDGSLSNYVVRYHKIDANGTEVLDEKGKPRKTFRPWSVLRQADGTLTWTQKGVNAPRQVHNVLAVKNATHVAVVEGEQCVERMRVFTSEWVPTTWQGGANSVGRTDWSTLRGKTVIGFADLDDAGQSAMQTVSEHCLAAGVARFGRVRIERIAQFTVKDGKLVPREGQVAKGFDVGDLAAEGMTWNMLVEHLGEENLVEWDQPPEDAGIPEDYDLEDGRLSRFVPTPNCRATSSVRSARHRR